MSIYTNYYNNIIPSFSFKIFVHMTLIEVLTFINSKVKIHSLAYFLLQSD